MSLIMPSECQDDCGSARNRWLAGAAAAKTLQLWDGELSYTDLADYIAAEARLAPALCTDIRDLDTKLASLPHPARPCRHHDINSGCRHHQRRAGPGRASATRPVQVPGRRTLVQWACPLTASGVNGRHGPPQCWTSMGGARRR
jgi:hypothetical protein